MRKAIGSNATPRSLGTASRLTRGNGGHMLEVSGLWTRTGIDRR